MRELAPVGVSVLDDISFVVSFCGHMIGEGGTGDGGDRSESSGLGLGERLRLEEEAGECAGLCAF